MGKETYFKALLLDLFDRDQAKKGARIYSIVTGKRTASTLYQTLDYQLESVFNLNPGLKRLDYEKLLANYCQAGLLEKESDDLYRLSQSGHDFLENYFYNHYRPKYLDFLRFSVQFTQEWWWKLQLLTQVFSEQVYGNSSYLPVIPHLPVQESVKTLLTYFKSQPGMTGQNLKEEWAVFLGSIEDDEADLIANLLTGHDQIGFSISQLAKVQKVSPSEMILKLFDSLHAYLPFLERKPMESPIFYASFYQSHLQHYLGLSPSVYESYKALKKGLTVDQIARKRHIKEATVQEHLLEMAMILKEFPFQDYVEPKYYGLLQQLFKAEGDIPYKVFNQRFPDIPFKDYRLVQIERKKHIDKT